MTPTSERLRDAGAWMRELHQRALEWVEESGGSTTALGARTPAYVDLLFSFGLARLGETDASLDLLTRAQGVLGGHDPAHTWLCNTFEYRIMQCLEGETPSGPLPTEQLESLDHLDRLQRYVVDRLRKHSRVLEPEQVLNPFRHWGASISDFEKAIAELTDLTDPNEIASRVEKMLGEVPKWARGDEYKARVLRAGLEAAPRVSEEFARKLLDQIIPTYDKLPEAKEIAPLMEQAQFLEKALFVAGHFGVNEAIHPLVTRFQRMLQSTQSSMVFQVLEGLAKSCFRCLRKLGLRDKIDQILAQIAESVLKGRDVKSIDFLNEPDYQGPASLRALLLVAGLWAALGRDNQAGPVFQVAGNLLRSNVLLPREQTQLACTYVSSLADVPMDVAQKRLAEVFQHVKGIKDTYTTSSHFSVSHLDVVESIVLTAVEVCSRP